MLSPLLFSIYTNGKINQRALLNRLDACNMEHGMDLEGSGELETDRQWIDDLGYQEWTHKPGNQLVRLNSQGEFLGG